MNQFLNYLAQKRPDILSRTKELMRENSLSLIPVSPWGKDVEEKLIPFIENGKTVRGALALFSYESSRGGKGNLYPYDLAAALELFHAGLLIHDDVMDKDILRRGKPAIHVLYKQEAKQLPVNNQKRFGTDMAIGLGDLCFFIAFKIIAGLPNASSLLNIISDELAKVTTAQMQDISSGLSGEETTIQNIIKTYRYKTARYTFSLPLICGRVMSNNMNKDTKDLENLGENLGMIYQIKDDELGLFEKEKNTGKPKGSDIRENKKTLIRFYLFEKADKNLKPLLEKTFGNKNITDEELELLENAVKESGILNEIGHIINSYYEKSIEIIRDLEMEETDKKILLDLSAYSLNRRS